MATLFAVSWSDAAAEKKAMVFVAAKWRISFIFRLHFFRVLISIKICIYIIYSYILCTFYLIDLF